MGDPSFMQFPICGKLVKPTPQRVDGRQEEDGPWMPPETSASCLARYFQHLAGNGHTGLWDGVRLKLMELLDFWSVVKDTYIYILYLLKNMVSSIFWSWRMGFSLGILTTRWIFWCKTEWISGFPLPAAGTRPSACGRPMRCVTWKVLWQLPPYHHPRCWICAAVSCISLPVMICFIFIYICIHYKVMWKIFHKIYSLFYLQ
jgi:hypothetical protein